MESRIDFFGLCLIALRFLSAFTENNVRFTTKGLVSEIGDRSYRVAIGLSLAILAWAWVLAWAARIWPAYISLVACLAVPYLAWTYLPTKLIQALELAFAPGLFRTSTLPLLEVREFELGQLCKEAGASLLLSLVAGALYASLTRLLARKQSGRDGLIWRWVLAQAFASLITACHLLLGLFIQARGRTPVLGLLSNLMDGLVYLPMWVVGLVYGQKPNLQSWGDWDVGTMLVGTGLLATLMALVFFAILSVPAKRYWAKMSWSHKR
jgi:hypothetical protein